MTEHEALLTLSIIPGVGPNRIRALVRRFRSARAVFDASLQRLMEADGIDKVTAQRIRNFDRSDISRKQLESIDRNGARLVTFWDKEYPENLKHIFDPPAFLFVKGAFVPEDRFAVAVIGSRQPSNYGRIIAQKLTLELAQRGLTIVSGLAYGIDTIAHANAANNNHRTIAVLGSGVDRIYPAENTRLAEKIIRNGVVISEFLMGAKPDRMNFPRRNRIICGLSLGVLVVEAGSKSGALITAMNALEQNREVFAVPGNIDSPRSAGTNDLIKQGAKCVTCVEDILEELAVHLGPRFGELKQDTQPDNLKPEEAEIYQHLSHDPVHVDALARLTGKPAARLLTVLLGLELKNAIKQLPGKMFVKI